MKHSLMMSSVSNAKQQRSFFFLVNGNDLCVPRRVVARGAQPGHNNRCNAELRQHDQLPHRVAQNRPRPAQTLQEVVSVRSPKHVYTLRAPGARWWFCRLWSLVSFTGFVIRIVF